MDTDFETKPILDKWLVLVAVGGGVRGGSCADLCTFAGWGVPHG
jgi:hypothetical protein